jgi:hypothetical protein
MVVWPSVVPVQPGTHTWIDQVPDDMQVHSGTFRNLTLAKPGRSSKARTIDVL